MHFEVIVLNEVPQLLETREFALAEIAKVFAVPQSLIPDDQRALNPIKRY